MTREAAESLCQVQNYLIKNHGCGLLIYDAYRPKRAVNHFVFWSNQAPNNDYELQRKEKHYPNVDKAKFFELGYVAEDSGHCYGNTVDIVLCNIETGKKLGMGARFDFMDPLSWTTASLEQIGEIPYRNRQILSEAMQHFSFLPYQEEFWHFSHGGKEGRKVQEPMDEPITSEMKGLGCN
jgi:D-alanyl-D-alanine dipeptidase